MVITAVIDVILPVFLSYAVDNFITPKTTDGILPFALLYFAAISLSSVLVVIFTRLSMVIEMGLGRDLKRACFVHLQDLSLSYYNRTPVGYILARVMSDTGRISALIAWSLEDVFWSIAYVFSAFVSMFIVNPTLALIVLAVVPPIAAVTFFFQSRILSANREIRRITQR